MTHVISSYFLIGYPFIVLAENIVKINHQTSSGNDAMSMVLKHSLSFLQLFILFFCHFVKIFKIMLMQKLVEI